jgi:hypothetical protein
MSEHQDPWRLGYNAFGNASLRDRKGAPLRNPYPEGTKQYQAYEDGWYYAQEEAGYA